MPPPAPAKAQPAPPPELSGLPPWLRHAARTVLHLAGDGAAVALAYALAYHIRFNWDAWVALFPVTGDVPPWSLYERILYAVVPLWLMIFWYSSALYTSPWIGGADRVIKVVKGCFLGMLATMVSTYIYRRLEYSRMMLLLAFPVSAVLVSLSQAVVLWFDSWMARHEAARPVALVGGGTLAKEIRRRIGERHPGAEVMELSEPPAPAELERLAREKGLIELILLRSAWPHERILELAEACDAAGVAFKMVPDLLELRFGEVQLDESLGLPSYRLQHTALSRMNALAKRVFDLVFSLAVLIAAGIPFLLLCALIRLDSAGPALYRQKRYGFRGKVFSVFKFRTMVADAESKIQDVKNLNDQKGAFFKAKNDPRVTRVGTFLRRFSLDEFPQFLNVLAGDMSVVGPRPLAVTTGELESLQKEFGATAKKRMSILPGITGLWQVSGRSDVDSGQRFALDLFYIEHWSLGLDLEIILRTVPVMLLGKGAY